MGYLELAATAKNIQCSFAGHIGLFPRLRSWEFDEGAALQNRAFYLSENPFCLFLA
jgi:hypothetical protein